MSETNFDGLLRYRCIGPFRGGRVVAVAGDTKEMSTFYFGACAGGVWKTTDAGTYWECVSDGFFNTASVGALAVSESDPNVIYAGTGETTIRIDVSHGDGVYKSTDAGRTWQHMGLSDTRHIAKIKVHPQNPDIVWVAALGHAFGPNTERGVFKSSDGGKTWEKVLFRSNKAGAIDLTLDAQNPRILYATVWEAYRNFWQISSGGPDSSIYKSVDGGETWSELTHNPGLPKGTLGKMGVVTSPAKSGRVWAIIENAEAGGLYRSDDYGETWQQTSDDQRLISRAWYYMHLTADPQNADVVYVNNLQFWKSTDGGHNFTQIGTPHGDNHDLWIDPQNPLRMVQGNDGGANVSFNGGVTWSSIYNQPTAQFYHLDVDSRDPYFVYGTQQDNSSVAVPSRSPNQSITWGDCFVAGTGESGYIAVHPKDPDIVFVGAIGSSPGGGNALQRYDHRTKQIRLVTTWPEAMTGRGAGEHRYRFAWTYPIFFSPHDAKTLYIGGNHVFKSTDEGQSWKVISPDLTKADPETLQPSGGPINKDAVGAETYATVFGLAESPVEKGLLWAGSDDGLIHISKDGGKNWKDITPSGLPDRAMVSMIEPSPHEAGTAYLAATKYKLDDYQPYLFKTTNYGKRWQRVDRGIPRDDFTRVIREDPSRKNLLYAGTETGIHISFDAGRNWQKFQLNLPVCPVHDLKIKNNDLVIGTHGRSFWVLDDLTPLHSYKDSLTNQEAHLFKPRDSARVLPQVFEGAFRGAPGKNYMGSLGIVAAYVEDPIPEGGIRTTYLDSGENPPKGVIVTYHLKNPEDKVTLTFKDKKGEVLREFSSLNEEALEKRKKNLHLEVGIPAKEGFNRFVWDMRLPRVSKIEGSDVVAEMNIPGPKVVPGTYQVTLSVNSKEYTEDFEITRDPMAEKTKKKDLQAQFKLWKSITDKAEDTVGAINRLRDLRSQLGGWAKRAGDDSLKTKASELKERVLELEKTLAMPDMRPGWPDSMNSGVRLLDKLIALIPVVSIGDYKPTNQAQEVFDTVSKDIDAKLKEVETLINSDLKVFNESLVDNEMPHVAA